MHMFEFMFYVMAPCFMIGMFVLSFISGTIAGSRRKIFGYGLALNNMYFNPSKQVVGMIIPLLLLALLPYQYLETPDVFGYVSLLGYNILIFGAWFLFFGIGILPFCHYVGLGLGYVAGKVIRKPS